MNSTKNIGILELGAYTTSYYLEEIKKIGFSNSTKTIQIKVHPTNFDRINMHLPYGFKELIPIVEKEIIATNELGIDVLVIPNMTLHLTVDQMNLPTNIRNKIIHPFHEIIQELKSKNVNKISLFGTRHTMQSEYIKAYFISENISISEISQKDIQEIDALRLAVYARGPSVSLSKEFQNLGAKYINPVIICTELSLINRDFYDASTTQIKVAVSVR